MVRNLLFAIIGSVCILSSCCEHVDGCYYITDFGAKPDGKTLATAAIQAAIDKCNAEGGGRVVVPEGDYLVATINLKSDVELYLAEGSRLVATTDLAQYQRHNSDWAGVIFTEDQDNVSITGHGEIFGQGMEFMYPDSAKVISGPVLSYVRQGKDLRKVKEGIGDGPLHPKDRFRQMIIFSNCTNVTLEDFKCVDSPYWCFLIVHCDGVKVRGIDIDNNLNIPNSDGLDVISSSNVNISDCNISCGDDAMVLSGYKWHFGDPGFKNILRPVRNINVNNCVLRSRSSAIRIGGWDQNPMSDMNLSNINIYDSNCGIGICIRDSAGLSNVNFTNINIHTRLHTGDWWGNGEPIKITAIRDRESVPGTIRNLFFTNIVTEGENSVIVYASPESTIENVVFQNFDFTLKQSPIEEVAGGNYDFRPSSVPEREFFAVDKVPVFYGENIDNLTFSNGNFHLAGEITAPYIRNGYLLKNVDNFKNRL